MQKCIYTKKDGSNATFTSEEHIFPRCIGGVNTLNKDWVSTEFNNDISKCEKVFARAYPLVAMPRMLLGSTGRAGNHGQAGISFLLSPDTRELTLGYIKDGQPISIPQISIFIPPFEEKNTNKLHGVINNNEEYKKLFHALANYKGKFRIIKINDSALEEKLLMGWIKGQIYLGVSEQVTDATAVDYANRLIGLIKHIQENSPSTLSTETTERQVKYETTVSFCLHDILRVYGKIAFNVLAHLKGHDFALRPEFNIITNAITTGTDTNKWVRLSNNPFEPNISNRVLFENDEHVVFVYGVNNYLVADVNLYGTPLSMIVILSDRWKEPFKICGYICDWRNHKEYLLENYIMQVIQKRNSSSLGE